MVVGWVVWGSGATAANLFWRCEPSARSANLGTSLWTRPEILELTQYNQRTKEDTLSATPTSRPRQINGLSVVLANHILKFAIRCSSFDLRHSCFCQSVAVDGFGVPSNLFQRLVTCDRHNLVRGTAVFRKPSSSSLAKAVGGTMIWQRGFPTDFTKPVSKTRRSERFTVLCC